MNWNFSTVSHDDNYYISSQNLLLSITNQKLEYIKNEDLKLPMSLVGSYDDFLYAMSGPILYKLEDSKIIDEIFLARDESSDYQNRAIHYMLDNIIFYMIEDDLFSFDLNTQKKTLVMNDLPSLVRIRQNKNGLILIHLNGGFIELKLNENLKVIDKG